MWEVLAAFGKTEAEAILRPARRRTVAAFMFVLKWKTRYFISKTRNRELKSWLSMPFHQSFKTKIIKRYSLL